MAIDPPYRLDPLQNVVDVKWGDVDDGGSQPGNENCWGFFLALFINPDIGPGPLRWGTPDGYKYSPGEAAAAFGYTMWYVDSSNVIACYEWQWLVGEDCGFVPGPFDEPPVGPPDDWIGFGFSPNSEE